MDNKQKKYLEKYNKYLTSLLYNNTNTYSTDSPYNIQLQDVFDYLEVYENNLKKTFCVEFYKNYLEEHREVYKEQKIKHIHFFDFIINLYQSEKNLHSYSEHLAIQDLFTYYLSILEKNNFPLLDIFHEFLKTTSTTYLSKKQSNDTLSYQFYFHNLDVFLTYCKEKEINQLSAEFITSVFPKKMHTSSSVNLKNLSDGLELSLLSPKSEEVAQLFLKALYSYKPDALKHDYDLKKSIYQYLKSHHKEKEIEIYCHDLNQSSFFSSKKKFGQTFSFNVNTLLFQYNLDKEHSRHITSAINGIINVAKEPMFLNRFIPEIDNNSINNVYISTVFQEISANFDFNSEKSLEKVKTFLENVIPLTFHYVCADISHGKIDYSPEYYQHLISKAYFANKINNSLQNNKNSKNNTVQKL